MPQTHPVPVWPRIEAVTRPDGSGELTINGTSYAIETTDLDDARASILDRVAATAAKLGRPVRVATTGPEGDWPLIVHPDGTVEEDPTQPARPRAVEEPPPAAFSARSVVSAPAPGIDEGTVPEGSYTTPAPGGGVYAIYPAGVGRSPAAARVRPAMTGVEKLLARIEERSAPAKR